ncbi:MAG: pantetheine-phosphate adenylyltransferase [Nitrososphaerota archaeon]|nr:pantetheine-phosphate adenylyltransferase [Nitrososphaerota archaeon]
MRRRRTFDVLALGGTFDHFHRGHRALLDEGFGLGRAVLIGIVSDELARSLGKRPDEDYGARRSSVESYIRAKGFKRGYRLFPLSDPFGPLADDPAVEAVVVTPESLPRGESANATRLKNGLKPVQIIMVPLVLADDGARISSTRIRKKEIDREGRLLRRRDDASR